MGGGTRYRTSRTVVPPHPALLSLSCPWDMHLEPLVVDSWQVTVGTGRPWGPSQAAQVRGGRGQGEGAAGVGWAHPPLCRQNDPRFRVLSAAGKRMCAVGEGGE